MFSEIRRTYCVSAESGCASFSSTVLCDGPNWLQSVTYGNGGGTVPMYVTSCSILQTLLAVQFDLVNAQKIACSDVLPVYPGYSDRRLELHV